MNDTRKAQGISLAPLCYPGSHPCQPGKHGINCGGTPLESLAMPLHFPPSEYAARVDRARTAVAAAGFDAVLLFAPESQYWLTGYDTFGFAMFQCLILTADGGLHLMTRAPDLRQARHTSTLADDQIHVWPEHEGANPARDLAALLDRLGLGTARLGYESGTAGLTDYNGRRLRDALGGMADASDLIRALRRVKSPAEIDMHRRAAALSDDALDAALDTACAGAFEGDILAAMQGAVFRGGGDYAGNEFILGSGPGALMCRSYSGRRHLDAADQLTLEWSGSYARYHAAMMRTLVIGRANAAQRAMFAAAHEALEACEQAIRPGAPMGDVHAAHVERSGIHQSSRADDLRNDGLPGRGEHSEDAALGEGRYLQRCILGVGGDRLTLHQVVEHHVCPLQRR